MAHKWQHLVMRIPQELCGYLMWTLQFCWHCLFDQFSFSLSACIPLVDVTGLSPSGASTRAAALISTCVDMTSHLKVVFPLPLSLPRSFPTSFLSHVVPTVAFERSGFSPLTLLPHSHSPSVFHSVSLCLSPYQGFLINGEPWCLSYQQITLLSINYTDRAGRLRAMDDTHTHIHSHAH